MKILFLALSLVLLIVCGKVFSETSVSNQMVTNGTVSTQANTEKKEDYMSFAVGISTIDFFGTLNRIKVPKTYTMIEFAVLRNLALQIDLGLIASDIGWLFQIGGGLRYYFAGNGLIGIWGGGYCDYFKSSFSEGTELALLTGYKLVGGPFFIDPYVGGRAVIVSPVFAEFYFGLNIGLCF